MDATICGFDPGLARTGYAVLRVTGGDIALVDAGVCRIQPHRPLAERLAALHHDIQCILGEHRPDCVGVEEVFSHYQRPRTAVLMGHARGVILLACSQAGSPVLSFSATRIKKFLTGNGQAGKLQVQAAVQRTLGLPNPPEPNDVADAAAAALCCAAQHGHDERFMAGGETDRVMVVTDVARNRRVRIP